MRRKHTHCVVPFYIIRRDNFPPTNSPLRRRNSCTGSLKMCFCRWFWATRRVDDAGRRREILKKNVPLFLGVGWYRRSFFFFFLIYTTNTFSIQAAWTQISPLVKPNLAETYLSIAESPTSLQRQLQYMNWTAQCSGVSSWYPPAAVAELASSSRIVHTSGIVR